MYDYWRPIPRMSRLDLVLQVRQALDFQQALHTHCTGPVLLARKVFPKTFAFKFNLECHQTGAIYCNLLDRNFAAEMLSPRLALTNVLSGCWVTGLQVGYSSSVHLIEISSIIV